MIWFKFFHLFPRTEREAGAATTTPPSSPFPKKKCKSARPSTGTSSSTPTTPTSQGTKKRAKISCHTNIVALYIAFSVLNIPVGTRINRRPIAGSRPRRSLQWEIRAEVIQTEVENFSSCYLSFGRIFHCKNQLSWKSIFWPAMSARWSISQVSE